MRALVDDEPFDVRSATLRSHERVLDFRADVLRRRADWVSPASQQVRVSSVRLVSIVPRAVASVLYEVKSVAAPQAEGFTEHQPWDFEHTTTRQYPLLLHFPYLDLYRKQAIKQADPVLALHLRRDAFSAGC